ncbi:DNA-processing protein DprA [Rhodovulum sp. DZ06]|uniref:DNA-processing protein DprA n=1 Tax=Rhodovulum sp. DZ06 TaxID=3425126 RepID=UPI003D340064
MTLDIHARSVEPAPVTALEALDYVRLARSRNVGPASFRRLLARFGTPAKALEALPRLAAGGGLKNYRLCSEEDAALEVEAALNVGAAMLAQGRAGYPAALSHIPDAPPFIWARGRTELAAKSGVAVIGGRNASALGLRMAREMAHGLGDAGWVTVSGLARGVDAAAHEGALDAQAGTIAVVAGGVDIAYPPENADLMARIGEEGLILSEAPMGLHPQGRHFPRRNRIVSGLSRAVVVIEAAERSGSLITASFALEQGREVMAVPGAPMDPRAAGGNALIREGAPLVRGHEDVIEALEQGLRPARSVGTGRPDGMAEAAALFRPRAGGADAALRRDVAELLGLAPVEEDELARLTGADLAALSDALLELELAGRLDRRPGGMLALRPGD